MPGVSGVGSTPFFAAQLCGVSAKLNHSNSSPHIGCMPSLLGALDDFLQQLARADRKRRVPSALMKSPRKERHMVVPGHVAPGRRDRAAPLHPESRAASRSRSCCRNTIGHVPAEHDVAEPESAVDCGQELVLVQVLPAQHAVDIGDRDLDLAVAESPAPPLADRSARPWRPASRFVLTRHRPFVIQAPV